MAYRIYDNCTACGECIDKCHVGAIAIDANGKYFIHEALCTDCNLCTDVCPADAVDFVED